MGFVDRRRRRLQAKLQPNRKSGSRGYQPRAGPHARTRGPPHRLLNCIVTDEAFDPDARLQRAHRCGAVHLAGPRRAPARKHGAGTGHRGRLLHRRHLRHPASAWPPRIPQIRLFRHPKSIAARAPPSAPPSRRPRGDFSLDPGRRPGIRPQRIPAPAASAARRPRRRGLRLALPGRRADARAALLALHDQQGPHPGLQHVLQPQPDGHGDLLQGFPHRPAQEHPHPLRPLRLRAGDRHEERQAQVAHLRSAHQLSRPHLRRGQEDRLEGRRQGACA